MDKKAVYETNKIVVLKNGATYKIVANNVSEYFAANEVAMHSIVSWLKMQQQVAVSKESLH